MRRLVFQVVPAIILASTSSTSSSSSLGVRAAQEPPNSSSSSLEEKEQPIRRRLGQSLTLGEQPDGEYMDVMGVAVRYEPDDPAVYHFPSGPRHRPNSRAQQVAEVWTAESMEKAVPRDYTLILATKWRRRRRMGIKQVVVVVVVMATGTVTYSARNNHGLCRMTPFGTIPGIREVMYRPQSAVSTIK